jgi:hypothetical protein
MNSIIINKKNPWTVVALHALPHLMLFFGNLGDIQVYLHKCLNFQRLKITDMGTQKIKLAVVAITGALLLVSAVCMAQYRPELFFREDWKEIPPAIPVTQEHVSNADLILNLYGAGADSIKKSNHDKPADDPFYIWSGLCTGNWAVSLKHKDSFVDLSEFAKIRWRSKQGGFRNLRIILKQHDGKWLISDQYDGPSKDWRVSEFNIADIQWFSFDPQAIYETKPVDKPDLTKIDEIGFTDLMRGGQSNSCSRLDWIEVYGKPVPRK